MGEENPIRTLGDYSKPSHEGYRYTIELPVGNNVDPNQHLKDFLKLVDSLELDGKNRERTRLRLFQFSLHDQASNWLERLLAGSITTWEDLTTRFLAQLFPLVPHHGLDLWLQIQIFYDHVDGTTQKGIDYATGRKHRKLRPDEAWAIIERLAQYEDERWNDAFIPNEVILNYENPNIKQLLGIMERKVDTLMKDAISLMGKNDSVFWLETNEMYRPPSEPSRQEEFEHIMMNFIFDQEERIRQLKDYVQVITKEFMEFSLEVARRLPRKNTYGFKLGKRANQSHYNLSNSLTVQPPTQSDPTFVDDDPIKRDPSLYCSFTHAMSKRARSTRGQASSSHEETMEEKVRKFGFLAYEDHQMNYDNLARYDSLHKGVTFRLGGLEREMSLLEFGWRVGLYTERESKDVATLSGLRRAKTVNSTHLTHLFWPSIGDDGFNMGNTKSKSITDPRIKLAHRCITMTIMELREEWYDIDGFHKVRLEWKLVLPMGFVQYKINAAYILVLLVRINAAKSQNPYVQQTTTHSFPPQLSRLAPHTTPELLRTPDSQIFLPLPDLSERQVPDYFRKPPELVISRYWLTYGFRKKSLVKMGVTIELHKSECCWPATRGVVEENEGDDEEGDRERGNEGVRGSANIYRNMSAGDWQVRQARCMDQKNNQWGRLDAWMEQQYQRAYWMYDHIVRQFQHMSTRDNLEPHLLIDPFLGFEADYPPYGY
ncbi:zinc finger, CCHC-type containing protein [Tanacetum coccineum]